MELGGRDLPQSKVHAAPCVSFQTGEFLGTQKASSIMELPGLERGIPNWNNSEWNNGGVGAWPSS